MPIQRAIIPNTQLELSIPQDLRVKLDLLLFSPLEGRVPKGAYKQFFIERLLEYFEHQRLEIPGCGTISGAPKAIACLRKTVLGE